MILGRFDHNLTASVLLDMSSVVIINVFIIFACMVCGIEINFFGSRTRAERTGKRLYALFDTSGRCCNNSAVIAVSNIGFIAASALVGMNGVVLVGMRRESVRDRSELCSYSHICGNIIERIIPTREAIMIGTIIRFSGIFGSGCLTAADNGFGLDRFAVYNEVYGIGIECILICIIRRSQIRGCGINAYLLCFDEVVIQLVGSKHVIDFRLCLSSQVKRKKTLEFALCSLISGIIRSLDRFGLRMRRIILTSEGIITVRPSVTVLYGSCKV